MNLRLRLAKLEQKAAKPVFVRTLTDTERAHHIQAILLRDPASVIANKIRVLLDRAAERRAAIDEQ